MSLASDEQRQAIEQVIQTKAYLDDPELVPWYTKELQDPTPDVKALFEQYSHIPEVEIVAHIKKVRDEAFKVYPYPCLGNWGFLYFSIGANPAYAEVLQRVKDGQTFLDLGCCMGQDIRKLVHAGASSANTYASDITENFWEPYGFDLFQDRDSLKTQFIKADIFAESSDLDQINGKVDIVNAASFFHLFDWDAQVVAAKRVVRLLKPVPGSLVVGRQGGKPIAGDFAHLTKQMTAWWHNPESWAKLWEQVGEETNTKWEVHAELGEEDLSKRMKTNLVPPGTRYLPFTVRRL